jgi:serine/threonine-protein kinase
MEYAEGITTLDLLRECYVKARPLGVAQALYIAAEVAKGLGYAHARSAPDGSPLGIVHRDLNPRNIVVSPAGEVKILDFGIARSSVKKHQTGSGIIKGTPGYMAPEQVLGYSVDARADQYGLAIILHELLTVRRLISVKDAAEHRAKLQEGPLQAPSFFRPDIPPGVDAVVMKALAYRPEERYLSSLDFEDGLRQEIAAMGAAVTSRSLSNTIASIKSASPADPPQPVATRVLETRPKAPVAVPVAPPPPAPAAGLPQPPVSAGSSSDLPPVKEDFTQVSKSALPAPLPPSLPVASVSQRPATQVLALNAEVAWAGKIGDDAEMLVLAKAMGLKSKTPQRAVLGGLLGAAVLVGLWAAVNPAEFKQMISRAQDGRRAVVGTLVVKSKPSGATVFVDGVESGKTNLRLEQVVLDVPRTLTIKTFEGQEMTRVVEEKDFTGPEHKLEVMFEPGMPQPPPAAEDAGPPPAKKEDGDEKPAKGGKHKKKKKGG